MLRRLAISLLLPATAMAQAPMLSNQGALISVKDGAMISVHGNTLNQTGGTFHNSDTIILFGDWQNDGGNGAFTSQGEGVVTLMGGNQDIKGQDITDFYDLRLEGYGIKYGLLDVRVHGFLRLRDREMDMDTHTVRVSNPDTGAVTTGRNGGFGFVSSLENGGLLRWTSATLPYRFPVGSSLGTLRFRPLDISPVNTDTGIWKVRMANLDAAIDGFDRNLRDSTLCSINDQYYHRIWREMGNDSMILRTYFDPPNDGMFQRNAHWQNQPRWEPAADDDILGASPVYPLAWLQTTTAVPDFTYFPFALAAADSVELTADANPICAGDTVTYTATGGFDYYNFYVNGVLVQTGTDSTYAAPLQDDDIVTLMVVSADCVAWAEPDTLQWFLHPIDLVVNPQPACYYDTITTTATPGFLQYDFYVNGNVAQSGPDNTLPSTAFQNGDSVWVVGIDVNCSYPSDTVLIRWFFDTVTLTVDADTICNDSAAIFTATGGFLQYSFYVNDSLLQDGPDSLFIYNNFATGDSVVVIAQDSFCFYVSDTIGMTIYDHFIALSVDIDSLCPDSTAIFTATTGFFNYEFYVNGNLIQNGPANTFSYNLFANGDTVLAVGTDENCRFPSNELIMFVYEHPLILTSFFDTVCANTAMAFTATAGFDNYEFFVNGLPVQNGPQNQYTAFLNDLDVVYVVGTDPNCNFTSNTDTVHIYQDSVFLTGTATGICLGDSVTFTATPGYDNYQFIVNGQPVQIGPSNTYQHGSVTFSDTVQVLALVGGCLYWSNEWVVTTYVNNLVVNVTPAAILCPGDTATFTATAGYTQYAFYLNGSPIQIGPSNTFQFLPPGGPDTVVVLATIGSCTFVSLNQAFVNTYQNSIALAANNVTVCAGDPVTFTATPGFFQYDFYINGVIAHTGLSNIWTTVILQDSSVVTVVGTDANCDWASNGVTITVLSGNVDLVASDTILCFGDSVTFTATPGYVNYTFYRNGVVAQDGPLNTWTTNNIQTGNAITVYANDGRCTYLGDTIFMTVLPNANISLSVAPDEICIGDSAIFTATAGFVQYDFYLNGNLVQSSPSNVYDAVGLTGPATVYVIGYNGGGCDFNSPSATVSVLPLPTIDIIGDNLIYVGETTALNANGSPDVLTYEWAPFATLDCATCPIVVASPLVTTTYAVTVSTAIGCIAVDTFTVYVDNAPVDPDTIFRIPNCITPNGDGSNDTWIIDNLPLNQDYEIVIVNRWGNEVFRTNNYQNDFDGTWHGAQLPAGTYYYVVRIGLNQVYKGPFTIIRQ